MEINFKGKRALVTGAGKGIGRHCAITLLKCGAQVVALTRTQADLDTLKADHPTMETLCVDLADWEKTKEAVRSVLPIDLLVNNAAVSNLETFLDISEKSLDDDFAVNVKSYINVGQVVAHSMINRKVKGAIVNVSSIFSKIAWSNYGAYCISKGAVDQVTRCMALELGPYGIRTNSVHPTLVMTPATLADMRSSPEWVDTVASQIKDRCPLGEMAAELEDCSNQIVHLLSELSHMVNGSMLLIDGGLLVH